ncbi:peroxiredoxin-like family protein [Zeaxanthinibacter enoshimensis]|uniref:peroxiredoxin-like family protein n=1 Tax=Zeaxanthinibacter enoshimensis TaxID=392009 RepID=UPI003564B6EB
MLIPNEKVPQLKVPLINGAEWDLYAQEPENFTLVIFYRGLHCPVCKSYLEDLAQLRDKFAGRGVHIIAISSNKEELAKKTAEEWDIPGLPVGYGMSMEQAQEWGLYISGAISDKEPGHFFEPGLFLIRPDQKLYAGSVQTMPFARPRLAEVLKAVDFILENDYPARGAETNYEQANI